MLQYSFGFDKGVQGGSVKLPNLLGSVPEIFRGKCVSRTAHTRIKSFWIALSSIYSQAGNENSNSPCLCVDGGNSDPVLSRYATSGRRLLMKAQELNSSTWLSPQRSSFTLFHSHFSINTTLEQTSHALSSLDNSLIHSWHLNHNCD